MAYQTGSASGPNDMLEQLRVFAVAQGWTSNRNAVIGSGREVCLSKGSAYFNLRSFVNETVTINGTASANKTGIAINGSDGYSAGALWDQQPGHTMAPNTTRLHGWLPFVLSPGPFPSYHIFASDSKTIYLEIEVVTGTYQRLGFGSLDLFNSGASGGGRFFYATGGNAQVNADSHGTSWLGNDVNGAPWVLEEVPFRGGYLNAGGNDTGSYIRVAVDSFDGWAQSARSNSQSHTGVAAQGGGTHDWVLVHNQSTNPLNGVGILFPHVVSVNRSNIYQQPIGIIPAMRYMDMTNYLPGDEFTIGSDVWKVFPWWQKGGRSGQYGIAYRKVV